MDSKNNIITKVGLEIVFVVFVSLKIKNCIIAVTAYEEWHAYNSQNAMIHVLQPLNKIIGRFARKHNINSYQCVSHQKYTALLTESAANVQQCN